MKVYLRAAGAGGRSARRKIVVVTTPAHARLEVVVARAPKRVCLVPVFKGLSELLGGAAQDHTLTEVQLENGQRVLTSTDPTRQTELERTFTNLTDISEDSISFKHSVWDICAHPVTWGLPMGLLVLVGGINMPHYRHFKMAQFILLAGYFWIVATFYLRSWLLRWTITVERPRNAVVRRPAFPFLGKQNTVCILSDVVALQMCAEPNASLVPLKTRNAMYELNLVLSRPEPNRVNLCRHRDREVIMEYSRQVSSFLDLPVLDHTAIDIPLVCKEE